MRSEHRARNIHRRGVSHRVSRNDIGLASLRLSDTYKWMYGPCWRFHNFRIILGPAELVFRLQNGSLYTFASFWEPSKTDVGRVVEARSDPHSSQQKKRSSRRALPSRRTGRLSKASQQESWHCAARVRSDLTLRGRGLRLYLSPDLGPTPGLKRSL